jgi:hypothetical protein
MLQTSLLHTHTDDKRSAQFLLKQRKRVKDFCDNLVQALPYLLSYTRLAVFLDTPRASDWCAVLITDNWHAAIRLSPSRSKRNNRAGLQLSIKRSDGTGG